MKDSKEENKKETTRLWKSTALKASKKSLLNPQNLESTAFVTSADPGVFAIFFRRIVADWTSSSMFHGIFVCNPPLEPNMAKTSPHLLSRNSCDPDKEEYSLFVEENRLPCPQVPFHVFWMDCNFTKLTF